MRERIARALAVADGKDPDLPAWAVTRGGRTYPEGLCWRDQYGSKADAVLDALREPDEAMLAAMMKTPGMKAADSAMQLHQARGYGFDPKAFEAGSPLQQAWRAAIDAARKPLPGVGGE